MMLVRRYLPLLLALVLLLPAAGCQTLREIASLRDVDFAIDRVAQIELAGVDLDRIRSYEDIRAQDVLRLTSALSRNELPLAFELHLEALNPEDNSVQARLVEMDWTLFLDDRETISGVFDQNLVLPPGTPTDVPIAIRLDLIDFFGENLRDLVDLALAVSGNGGAPKRIMLQATPTIDTAIGPIRYPNPIQIVSREIGASTP